MPKDYGRIYGSGGNTNHGAVSTLHLSLEEQLVLDMALTRLQEDVDDQSQKLLSSRGLATLGIILVKVKNLINESDHQ